MLKTRKNSFFPMTTPLPTPHHQNVASPFYNLTFKSWQMVFPGAFSNYQIQPKKPQTRWQIFFLVHKDTQVQWPMTFCQPTLQKQSRSADRGADLTVANSSLPPLTEEGREGFQICAVKEPELKLNMGGAQVNGRNWMFWAPWLWDPKLKQNFLCLGPLSALVHL